jgi:hypothetical protein
MLLLMLLLLLLLLLLFLQLFVSDLFFCFRVFHFLLTNKMTETTSNNTIIPEAEFLSHWFASFSPWSTDSERHVPEFAQYRDLIFLTKMVLGNCSILFWFDFVCVVSFFLCVCVCVYLFAKVLIFFLVISFRVF